MKATIAAVVIGFVAGAANAAADVAAAEALARKSACLSCHAVDKKLIGPAFKDVAARYRGDNAAESKLVDKIKKGGSGTWGAMPMPANSRVKDDDIKVLAQWILSM